MVQVLDVIHAELIEVLGREPNNAKPTAGELDGLVEKRTVKLVELGVNVYQGARDLLAGLEDAGHSSCSPTVTPSVCQAVDLKHPH